ncbi:MarR family winged helix-turn-helix transcriptional regulator [Alsobacter sp. SYSU BS001988]
MPDSFERLKLDNQLCFSVYSTAQAFTAAYKPFLDRVGLTYTQYLVLMVLWETNGLTVSAIGERLGLDSGTLTPLLKRLETSGFVIRRRNPADERQVLVTLTDRGWSIQAEALTARGDVVCALGKSEAEVQKLKTLVDELQTALSRRSREVS